MKQKCLCWRFHRIIFGAFGKKWLDIVVVEECKLIADHPKAVNIYHSKIFRKGKIIDQSCVLDIDHIVLVV
jgi:hypothetical protein